MKKTFCDQFKNFGKHCRGFTKKFYYLAYFVVFKEMQTFCLLIMSAWIIIHHTKLHT